MRQLAVMSVLGAIALSPWPLAVPRPAEAAARVPADVLTAERQVRAAIAVTTPSLSEPALSARVLVVDVDRDGIDDLLLADAAVRTLYPGIRSAGFGSGTTPTPAAVAPFEAQLGGTIEPLDASRSLAFLLEGRGEGGFEIPAVAFRMRVRAGDAESDAGSIFAPRALPNGALLAADVRDADGDGDLDLAVLAPAPAGVPTKDHGDPVSVPAVERLQLSLQSANPSAMGVRLAFALSRPGPVSLEAVDVRGRIVVRRELPGLDPGRHTIELARPGQLPPGLYLVRLRQEQESAAVKVVVLH